MREIKFRAWNVITKTMIDLKKMTPLALNMDTDGLFIPFSDGLLLMQYTGPKDKNGKEVYTSDFIKYQTFIMGRESGHYRTREVVKHEGCFGIFDQNEYDFVPLRKLLTTTKTKYISNFGEVAIEKVSEIEIIGNIYENPELKGE